MAALKRLDRAFGQGNPEFWKEIMMLSFYRHKNIVSLLGYCDDYGEKILVYEYASKKSLDCYLANNDLTWVQRLKICVGAAHGLAYLHTPAETQLRILHRDIKSSNILLDDNWNAKISDFGLSKFAPANNQFTFLVSNPVGTHGYIDPLYEHTGLLTKESDIYSFGVVLFEVLCGRLCYGNNCRPLAGLAQEYYEQDKISELVYSNIKDQINNTSLMVFTDIAYKCLKKEREERPLMRQLVSALENSLVIQELEDKKAEAIAGVNRAGLLNVKILRIRDVRRSKNPFSASNPYLILYINSYRLPQKNVKTSVKQNELNAEWNEEFTLFVENFHAQSLTIILHNMVSVRKHEYLGEATMKLANYIPEIPVTCNLHISAKNYDYLGNVEVEVFDKPFAHDHTQSIIEDAISSLQKAPTGTHKDRGLLTIIIHSAHLYHEKDNAHSSVTLFFRGETRKTKQPPTNENLLLEVVNNSWMGLIPGKESFGYVNISLADVVNKKWTNEIYELQPGYPDDDYINNFLRVELHWRTSE